MTTLRRLAVATVKTVIRLSPGSTKRWAEAMLAEMESVGSDWEALLWAVGSVRILSFRRCVRGAGAPEIAVAAKVLADRVSRRTWGGALTVGWEAVYFSGRFFHASNAFERTGCVGIVVAMLYLLWQLVEGRSRGLALRVGPAEQLALYRAELRREYEFYHGGLFWMRLALLLPGFVLVSIGGIVAHPATVHSQLTLLALYLFCWLLAIPNCLYTAKTYARELQRLDQMELEG